jgi:hypothetical protein
VSNGTERHGRAIKKVKKLSTQATYAFRDASGRFVDVATYGQVSAKAAKLAKSKKKRAAKTIKAKKRAGKRKRSKK